MISDVQIQFKITSISNSIARILHIFSGLYHKSRGVSRFFLGGGIIIFIWGRIVPEGRKKNFLPPPKKNHQGQKPTILN